MNEQEISALSSQISGGVCWCDSTGALHVVTGVNPAWPGPRVPPTQPVAVLHNGGIVRLLDAQLEDFRTLRPIPLCPGT